MNRPNYIGEIKNRIMSEKVGAVLSLPTLPILQTKQLPTLY